MKAECQIPKLREAATLAQRFTNKQAALEALQGILLLVEGKTLTMRATNLECGVEISIPASITEPGVVAIPGNTFASLIANLPQSAKTATLEISGSTLTIATEKSSSTIKILPHEDFPILPTVSGERSFTILAGEYAKALRSVAFCASVSGVKPELQSVMMVAENNTLVTAATDSFRLAEKKMPYKGPDTPKLLIPIRNAAELIRILEGGKGSVEVYYNDNQLSVRVGDTYFTSRLIDGAFPNYTQVLPSSYVSEALVLREDFAQALKTLAIFADKYSQVTIAIKPKKKELTLSARNPDIGEHVITLPITGAGEDLEMNFNGRYIADALQSISGESIRLGLAGAGKPLSMLGASDQGFLYIVMPMNR